VRQPNCRYRVALPLGLIIALFDTWRYYYNHPSCRQHRIRLMYQVSTKPYCNRSHSSNTLSRSVIICGQRQPELIRGCPQFKPRTIYDPCSTRMFQRVGIAARGLKLIFQFLKFHLFLEVFFFFFKKPEVELKFQIPNCGTSSVFLSGAIGPSLGTQSSADRTKSSSPVKGDAIQVTTRHTSFNLRPTSELYGG